VLDAAHAALEAARDDLLPALAQVLLGQERGGGAGGAGDGTPHPRRRRGHPLRKAEPARRGVVLRHYSSKCFRFAAASDHGRGGTGQLAAQAFALTLLTLRV
jgi:hypothetical protein